jgi:hypothetical protein
LDQIQAFEWESDGGGIHWKKLESQAQELSDMGISAQWIPRERSLYMAFHRLIVTLPSTHESLWSGTYDSSPIKIFDLHYPGIRGI